VAQSTLLTGAGLETTCLIWQQGGDVLVPSSVNITFLELGPDRWILIELGVAAWKNPAMRKRRGWELVAPWPAGGAGPVKTPARLFCLGPL